MQIKRVLPIILSLMMILSMTPLSAFASELYDMPNNWSRPALQSAVDNGLLQGNKGKISPNDYLTRAQMITIVNRAFKANETASVSYFTDVAVGSWYHDEVAKAVQMKTILGSGNKFNPNKNITREEAFVVLARAFKLFGGAESSLEKFSDKATVSSWAKDSVAALAAAGHVSGSNGKLNPQKNITRAEFAQIMNNLLKNYIKAPGTYTSDYIGNVMINVPDVILKDSIITGDLIIGDGVGNGDVTLDGVTVTGRTIVRGGGVNSIKIIGNSNIQSIIIARVDDKVRVFTEDGTIIGEVIVDGSDDVILEGITGEVTILAPEITVTANNADIDIVTIQGENSKVVISKDSTVDTLYANAGGTEIDVQGQITKIETSEAAENATINIAEDAKVGSAVINGEGTTFEGTGSLTSVMANADNVEVYIPNVKVTAAAGAEGVIAGDSEVKPGTTATIPKDYVPANVAGVSDENPPIGGGGGGGGIGGTPATVAVTGVTLNHPTLTFTEGDDAVTLIATVAPANASNKNVTWSSSNDAIATVTNGIVTPVAQGTVIITVTTTDGSKTATCDVTVNSAAAPDTTKPVITLNGEATVNVAYGSTYTDSGATAMDNKDGDITASIVMTGAVDTMTAGSYMIHYNVSDMAGNAADEVTRTVIVAAAPDTTKPVITLVGDATVNIANGAVYTDAGATAMDDMDGDITAEIIMTGTVNTAAAGTYTLHYNVSDAAGNAAIEVTRTVVVADPIVIPDTTKPVITLVGDSTVNVAFGSTYTDAGATAMDDTDGDITGDIVVTGTVNTAAAGTYTIHYNVSDAAGNAAVEVTRTVVVADPIVIPDTTKPVITLVGDSTVNVAFGSTYTDAGATAMDNKDGDITADIVVTGSVNTAAAGTYTIHYNVSDAAGNAAVEVTRTVIVGESGIPVTGVTVNPTSVTILVGGTEQIAATVAPSNATNKNVTWTSANNSLVTVDGDGNVYGVAATTGVNVTVRTEDGNKSANCLVRVQTEAQVVAAINSSTLNNMPLMIQTYWKIVGLDLTAYNSLQNKGQVHSTLTNTNFTGKTLADIKATFDSAVAVQAAIDAINAATADNMEAALNANADVLGLLLTDYMGLLDKTLVNTTLEFNTFLSTAVLKTTFNDIVAVEEINEATVDTMNAVIVKDAVTLGLNLTDYNNLTNKTPVHTALEAQNFTMKTEVQTAFIAAVAAQKAAEAVPTLSSIAVKTPAVKLIYTVGESLDITGLVIEGTYSDGSKKDESVLLTDITGFNSSAPAASQTLTVTIGGKTTTYSIEIKAPVITATMALVGEALGVKSYGITVTGALPGDVTQVIVNNNPVTFQVISGLVRFNSGTTVTSVQIVALGQTINVPLPVTITAAATLVGEALGVKSYGIQVTGATPEDVTDVIVNGESKTFQIISGLVRFNSGTTVTSIKIVVLGQTIDVLVP